MVCEWYMAWWAYPQKWSYFETEETSRPTELAAFRSIMDQAVEAQLYRMMYWINLNYELTGRTN